MATQVSPQYLLFGGYPLNNSPQPKKARANDAERMAYMKMLAKTDWAVFWTVGQKLLNEKTPDDSLRGNFRSEKERRAKALRSVFTFGVSLCECFPTSGEYWCFDSRLKGLGRVEGGKYIELPTLKVFSASMIKEALEYTMSLDRGICISKSIGLIYPYSSYDRLTRTRQSKYVVVDKAKVKAKAKAKAKAKIGRIRRVSGGKKLRSFRQRHNSIVSVVSDTIVKIGPIDNTIGTQAKKARTTPVWVRIEPDKYIAGLYKEYRASKVDNPPDIIGGIVPSYLEYVKRRRLVCSVRKAIERNKLAIMLVEERERKRGYVPLCLLH